MGSFEKHKEALYTEKRKKEKKKKRKKEKKEKRKKLPVPLRFFIVGLFYD
jgi:hypothetical protein